MASPSLNALFPQKSISPNKMIYHISRKRTEPRWVGGGGRGGSGVLSLALPAFLPSAILYFHPK